MEYVKYLIIGGGISGLSFAMAAEKDYLIVEKENEVGGFCRTVKNDGFVWDYAGHFFHFKTDKYRQLFNDNIPAEDIIHKDKCTKIIYKDLLVDYPFQTNIHQLEKEEFIDCLYDLFNKNEKESYDSFLDMLYGKFGKSITEKFLRPYNEKLYAVDLTLLDTDAMGRFFPYADKEQIINNMKKSGDSGSYNNTFLYPRNGAGSFIDVLYGKLDPSKVLLNTSVTNIDTENKVATLDDGEKQICVKYDHLINTAPFNVFLKLTDNSEYRDFSEKLSYNKVLVFNLGFNKKSHFDREHWMYIPDKNVNYYRIGFYDNILDDDRLSMYIEIGYPKNAEIDVDKELKLTLENLKKQGITDDTFELVAHDTIIMDPAYVHINTEHDKAVKAIMEELSEKGVYSIGRYGAWTYCSMEDSMLAAATLAEKLG